MRENSESKENSSDATNRSELNRRRAGTYLAIEDEEVLFRIGQQAELLSLDDDSVLPCLCSVFLFGFFRCLFSLIFTFTFLNFLFCHVSFY